MAVLTVHIMMLDLWVSTDSYDRRFICIRTVVDKHIGFFLHQKGSIANEMHHFFWAGAPLWSPLGAPDAPPDPLFGWGGGRLTIFHPP